jgi:outer membrane protein OmpA-like peptidoglycan-associated protein
LHLRTWKYCAPLFFALSLGNPYAADPRSERPVINLAGQRGVLHLYSAHTLGVGTVTLGLYGDAAIDQSFLKSKEVWQVRPDSGDTVFQKVPKNPSIATFNYYPFIGAGLTDFIDLSVMLPVHNDFIGKAQDFGAGDLHITLKVGTNPAYRTPVFDMGFIGAMILPTGDNERGYFPRHSYYFDKDSLAADTPHAVVNGFFTSGKVDFETHLALALDFSGLKHPFPLALHLNGGMHFTTALSNDNALLLSGAIEYHPWRTFALAAEINSEMRMDNVSHGFALNQDPLEFTPEMVITPSNGLRIILGSSLSLAAPSTHYSYELHPYTDRQRLTTGIEPKWRFFAQLGWSGVLIDRDRDKDGIFDRRDRCPLEPEDVDGFEDDDGCPDFDNDGDGIPDSLDKCPNKPEDKDNFQDADGCPDPDNDNDGIPDSVDKCPNIPEDRDGFQDSDGCPDYDNDADGIPDSVDKCPNIPEDLDGFQDSDGCPDVDNDLDGVPDSLDRCPNLAGSPENNGCPATEQPKPAVESHRQKAKEIKRGRVILRGVTFEQGTASLDPSSYFLLDQVVESLTDWPAIQLEIQGHTDNGGMAADPIELTRNRADVVRTYLVNRGIAPNRMSAVGKGGADPIADNSTKKGRDLNNRIELRRIDP